MLDSIPNHHPGVLEELGLNNITSQDIEKEIADHIEPYTAYLKRKENRQHFKTMFKGLVSDLDRKSIEPISLAFAGEKDLRNVQNFISRSIWNDQGMLEFYQKEVGSLLFHPEGMITGDGCDFPKKGNYSVGVARQHCGNNGKVDNCQASVMVGYASPEGHALLDFGLYMPICWFDDDHKKLWAQCHVPEDLEFKTKNELLLAMIHNMAASENFKGKYVGVDSAFGRDHKFLDNFPEWLIYFADVPCNTLVYVERPEMIEQIYSGRGRKPEILVPSFPARRVEEIANDDSYPWEDVVLGIGSKGPIFSQDKCLKVVEQRNGEPGKDVWLYIRRLEDGSIKYALCNESMEASINDIRKPALMRWSIEQCFKECKEYLGMDHYEVRGWHSWRRYILLALIAHLFINKLRRKFVAKVKTPPATPLIKAPVSAADFMEAAEKHEKQEEIKNPDIFSLPTEPQKLLTIGLVRTMINCFLVKTTDMLGIIGHQIKNYAASFNSYSKMKIMKMRMAFAAQGERT
jgi:SRSO17 transposase